MNEQERRLTEIQKWTKLIIDGVSGQLSQFMANKPAQKYTVTRISQNGTPVQSLIELPQALCELTDQMRVENGMRQIELDMQRALIESMLKLREEIERNRKVGESMLKEMKRATKKGSDENDE